ncbi:hypothetical protein SLA2020_167850 [Shorea laevis]
MAEKSKILVIGGTGYIGKFIVEAAAKAGYPTFLLRFFPSEFGNDVDRIHAVEPAKSAFEIKAKIRRAVEVQGKTLERIYVPEEQLLKNIQESPVPINVVLAISHSAFVKGDHTNFEIKPSFGVEASELYPDVKYTTVDEYLNRFV